MILGFLNGDLEKSRLSRGELREWGMTFYYKRKGSEYEAFFFKRACLYADGNGLLTSEEKTSQLIENNLIQFNIDL